MDFASCRQPERKGRRDGERLWKRAAPFHGQRCRLVSVQDAAEAVPAPEKQRHKKPSRREGGKKCLLNPLHLHKPLLYVAYWILQAQSLLGAVCRAHS